MTLVREALIDSIMVLRGMEWSKIRSETGWSSSGFCPTCDGPKFSGHKKTCLLGNSLLKSARALKLIDEQQISESGGTADAVASNPTALKA